MKNILEFLQEYDELEILKFDEDMIINKPFEVLLKTLIKIFIRNGIDVMC